MSKHYCMDRLMGVTISNKAEACCPFMEIEDADCCESEIVDFVIDNEFQKIDYQKIDEVKWNLIGEIGFIDSNEEPILEYNPHFFPYSNGPPLLAVELFILNCSYLL
jgi:hypothetical protein